MPLSRSLLMLPAEVGDLMDHTPESAYAHLRDTHPTWFLNPPGDGAIGIMRWPMTEGAVLHHDEERVVLEDPVVLPGGQQARRLRLLAARPEPEVAVLPLLGGAVVLTERFRHAARTWQWEIVRGMGAEGLSDTDNASRHLKDQLGATPAELVGLGEAHPDAGILADSVLLFAARIDAVGDRAYGAGIRRVRTVAFDEAEQMALTGQITDAVTISMLFRARQAGLFEEGPVV
ncbi:NUDIX hydrolase [Streptomyces lydicus]|uniref:NUDIX hydrolase n=1 Tax=Streptomyces lydicus TaxID=47763 RepID=UPI001F50CF64|nr:NUDIX hydrolase [Streptomyces lydicus]MCZ1011960.1 NUDIX hydrolase [Streptomyces lydicus]